MRMSGAEVVIRGIRRYSRDFAWIMGKRCPVCGAVLEALTSDLGLCPDCSKELQPRSGGFCSMCARIYALEDDSTHLCYDCRNHSFSWQGMSFFSVYQGLLKELILRYKFSGDLGLGNALGHLLLKAARRQPCDNIDSIVPVPVHSGRLRQRGFNQSLELARVLGRRINIQVEMDYLVKIRPTPPQSSMKRKLRLKSLKNVFAVKDDGLKGKSILLVDDIMTTGSTLEQCTRTLLRAGASGVRVVFLARAV
jgi:ComF family protein